MKYINQINGVLSLAEGMRLNAWLNRGQRNAWHVRKVH